MSYQIEGAIKEISRADPSRGISADVMKAYGIEPSKLKKPSLCNTMFRDGKEMILERYVVGKYQLEIQTIRSAGKEKTKVVTFREELPPGILVDILPAKKEHVTYMVVLQTPIKGEPIIELLPGYLPWREILEERLLHGEQAPMV